MSLKMERDIERALVKEVNGAGALCLKFVCPGWSGVPDRIILIPGGRVIFAELKRPKGGKVAELQQWWHNRLNRLGFLAVFVRDMEQVYMISGMIRMEVKNYYSERNENI